MLTRVTMPKLGESVTEGTVDRWLKQEGDWVALYEPLVEVITDKVNAEVPSPVTGRLVKVIVPAGQTVACLADLAIIEEPDTSVTSSQTTIAADEKDAQTERSTVQPSYAVPAVQSSGLGGAGERRGREGLTTMPMDEALRRRTTPLVRRLASQYGVDLSAVPGSGFGGRVRKGDLTAFVAQSVARSASPAETAIVESDETPEADVAGSAKQAAAFELLRVSPIRRAIAQHMTLSLKTAPQVTTAFEIDMTAVVRLRLGHRDDFKRRVGVDLTYQAMFMKVVSDALSRHPLLNSSWTEEGIRLFNHIHLGVAVAIPATDGRIGGENLLVPVIRHAERLSFRGLALATSEVIDRARRGKLLPDETQGGTFTVNNTGTLGSVISTPIIQQPQAAILTLESIVKRAIVVTDSEGNDSIAVRHMAFACLTFDHRVLDGLAACLFMGAIKRDLEAASPSLLD